MPMEYILMPRATYEQYLKYMSLSGVKENARKMTIKFDESYTILRKEKEEE